MCKETRQVTLDVEKMSQRKNNLSRSTVHMEGDEKESIV